MIRLALALALPSAPSPTPAESTSSEIDIVWRVDGACPDRVAFDRRVRRWSASTRGRVAANIQITRQTEGFRLRLEITKPHADRRELESADCQGLVDAAAIIVTLAASPASAKRPRSTTDADLPLRLAARPRLEPEPKRELSDPHRPDPPALATRPRPARRSRLRVGLRPEVGIGGGLLSSATLGISGVVSLIGPRWRAELGASGWLPPEIDAAVSPASARFTVVAATARGCGVVPAGPIEVPLCAGLEAGSLRGRGQGIADPRDKAAPWVVASLGPGLMWAPVRWIALWIRAEAAFALSRPAFHFDGVGSVLRTGLVGGRGAIGVEVRFP